MTTEDVSERENQDGGGIEKGKENVRTGRQNQSLRIKIRIQLIGQRKKRLVETKARNAADADGVAEATASQIRMPRVIIQHDE